MCGGVGVHDAAYVSIVVCEISLRSECESRALVYWHMPNIK